MKVRKILDDDYCLGHGDNEFISDSAEVVAQNVMTRLHLWKGSWFADTEDGVPYVQSILGKNPSVASPIIKSRILDTDGVISIPEFEAIYNPATRGLSISAKLQTVYGISNIEVDL